MPGVSRVQNFADVIGSLQDQIGAVSSTASTSQGTGEFTEADEVVGITDTVTVAAQANPAWGTGTWSGFAWG